MQELGSKQVEELRSRIEKAVTEFSLHVRGSLHAKVGISVGTANFGAEAQTLDQLLVAADQAMYRTKSAHKLAKLARETDADSLVELDSEGLVQWRLTRRLTF